MTRTDSFCVVLLTCGREFGQEVGEACLLLGTSHPLSALDLHHIHGGALRRWYELSGEGKERESHKSPSLISRRKHLPDALAEH